MDPNAFTGADGFRFINGSSLFVSTAADINNDRIADILLGDIGADYSATDSGSVYMIFGKNGGWGATFDLGGP